MSNLGQVIERLERIGQHTGDPELFQLMGLLLETRDLLAELSQGLRGNQANEPLEIRFQAEHLSLFVTSSILALAGWIEGTGAKEDASKEISTLFARVRGLAERYRELGGP